MLLTEHAGMFAGGQVDARPSKAASSLCSTMLAREWHGHGLLRCHDQPSKPVPGLQPLWDTSVQEVQARGRAVELLQRRGVEVAVLTLKCAYAWPANSKPPGHRCRATRLPNARSHAAATTQLAAPRCRSCLLVRCKSWLRGQRERYGFASDCQWLLCSSGAVDLEGAA